MIHYTGEYKILNLIFGAFPFIGTTLITQISENSSPIQSWLSIVGCLKCQCRVHPELIDIDSSRFWKCGRIANDAKYGVSSNHAIDLLNSIRSCIARSSTRCDPSPVAHLWLNNRITESQIAMGTGFNQLFRGLGARFILHVMSSASSQHDCLGQVGGVAFASAIFQSNLDSELRARITGPNAEEVRIWSWKRRPL